MAYRIGTAPKRYIAAALLAAIACAIAPPAVAQQQPNSGVSIGPSQNLQQSAPSVAPAEEHLLGTWGGIRTYLGNLGIDLTVDFTAEFAGNVSGGTHQGATFANQVGFEADIDWAKLAGLTGLSSHVVLVNRSGSSDSVLFGDHVNAVQEIYGGGGDVVVHLVYAYAEQSLYDGRVDIAAGRMPVLNDFAASTLYCNFMNVSICGNPGSLAAGDIGFSSYPDSTYGARLRVRPTAPTYIQVGVYDVSQGIFSLPQFRSGFDWSTSQDTGVEVPVEIGWEPTFGRDRLPGHYKLGFGYDSSVYPDLYLSAAGGPTVPGGAPLRRDRGKLMLWALADQMLIRTGPGDDQGLILLGAYTHGDPSTITYANQYTAGLLARGFVPNRPQDSIGALFTYHEISGALGHEQALEQAFGIPLTSVATGIQTHEMIAELNYDIHVTTGVNFQPEFEYVVHPNAQRDIHNAVVFGFKTHINF